MPPKGGLCVLGLIVAMGVAGPAPAGELPDTMERPGGVPERPLRLIVPYDHDLAVTSVYEISESLDKLMPGMSAAG